MKLAADLVEQLMRTSQMRDMEVVVMTEEGEYFSPGYVVTRRGLDGQLWLVLAVGEKREPFPRS